MNRDVMAVSILGLMLVHSLQVSCYLQLILRGEEEGQTVQGNNGTPRATALPPGRAAMQGQVQKAMMHPAVLDAVGWRCQEDIAGI